MRSNFSHSIWLLPCKNFDKEVDASLATAWYLFDSRQCPFPSKVCHFTTCVDAQPGEPRLRFCFVVRYRSISDIPTAAPGGASLPG